MRTIKIANIIFTVSLFALLVPCVVAGSISDINFYAKIIDQYGEPVTGVIVEYKATSEFLAVGTGFGETVSDNDGYFNTVGSKGTGLSIRKFIKPGYQFTGIQNFDNYLRFENSILWENYTKEKPYIFNAWKIENKPSVVESKNKLFLFTPDGRSSTFDLFAKGINHFKKGVRDGDFTVSFTKSNDKWHVILKMLNGGLQENNGEFSNLAPETGYVSLLKYNFPENNSDTAEKKYYIKLRNGKYYGQMTIEYRAYNYRDGKAALTISYIVNLDHGRELVRP